MKNSVLIFLTLIALTSCSYRICINNKLDHKEWNSGRNWKSKNDSCIVLESTETLPGSSNFIDSIEIISPSIFIWLPIPWNGNYQYYNVMVNRLRTEAKIYGANVIKIIDYGLTKNLVRYQFKANFYHLNSNLFEDYNKIKDSINKSDHENFCIAHIKSELNIADGPKIYFNDTLVGQISYLNKDGKSKQSYYSKKGWGGGFNVPSVEIKSHNDGKLSFETGNNPKKNKVTLLKGKEYYIHIVQRKYSGLSFAMTTRENY
jgi:hypothetical protein